jgi:hypothetical protein
MIAVMRVLIISLPIFANVLAWERYERPLVEPGEVVDNKHEFVWDIGPKLSMSIERDYRQLGIIDYNVEEVNESFNTHYRRLVV